jgi:hypothetical protein
MPGDDLFEYSNSRQKCQITRALIQVFRNGGIGGNKLPPCEISRGFNLTTRKGFLILKSGIKIVWYHPECGTGSNISQNLNRPLLGLYPGERENENLSYTHGTRAG